MHDDVSEGGDFADADRGLVATLQPGVVRDPTGKVVWDVDAVGAAVSGDRPDTVDPGLWRQSRLTAKQGLYEVTPGIYQVRGLDLSNMTLVEGERGVVVVDPLISAETAAAALALYREHRGDRPVTAVLYTHSHLDHFGGVLGVVSRDTDVPVVAPAHFLEHTVSENVYAGVAMLRRGMYYGGPHLPVGGTGTLGMGLGPGTSRGTVGLVAPTLEVTATGQEEVLDGVRFVFQLTPGTEAPSEMNFHLPQRRALCTAENATRTLHNILTLRGAEVRDARQWSRYLAETIDLFGEASDVAFASHHWPTWGTDRIVRYLTEQRDLYAYLHDQTLRLMNQGLVGSEIAEHFDLPPELQRAWHTHGYYGSVSHNVKAIYQRYLGWYDGNPAHLWQHPPQAAAQRYVETIGGIDATVAAARRYLDAGDLRFAAELGNHAVFAEPDHAGARDVLASAFERLGHGAENATWRNCYLTGAQELRQGIQPTTVTDASGLAPAMTVTQLFDALAIRIVGPKAWGERITLEWELTDVGERYRMELSNGALVHRPVTGSRPCDVEITLTRPQLLRLLAGGGADGVRMAGDVGAFARLVSLTDTPEPDFPVVTP